MISLASFFVVSLASPRLAFLFYEKYGQVPEAVEALQKVNES